MKSDFVEAYATQNNMTPEEASSEITRVILKVSESLAPSLVFGYHDVEDLKQEIAAESLLAFAEGRYDVKRPLENFLYVNARNRIGNLRRKTLFRAEKPCSCCDTYNPPASPCPRYLEWNRRNLAKRNIMKPLDVSGVSEEYIHSNTHVVEDAATRELENLIDETLPADLRTDYLRMKAGVPVPKSRRNKVRTAIQEILGE